MNISDYASIVGRSTVDELKLLGSRLGGKVIQNVNSTFTGGGVAEILSRMVPLLGQLGVDARWNIISGNDAFFQVTKKFHNALHGRQEEITPEDFDIFREITERNIKEVELSGDIIYIHDPQPVGLIARKNELGRKWIWRCHIDVSHPDESVWNFLHPYVVQYDSAVFSAPAFSRPLPIRQFLISPSIDPMSDKNRESPPETVDAVMSKYGILQDKPIITQVSRFDYLKDPVGVIQAFEMVRKSIDCRLVLAGGTATDDPESDKVLAQLPQLE